MAGRPAVVEQAPDCRHERAVLKGRIRTLYGHFSSPFVDGFVALEDGAALDGQHEVLHFDSGVFPELLMLQRSPGLSRAFTDVLLPGS